MNRSKASSKIGAVAAPKNAIISGSRAKKVESLINIYTTPRQKKILLLLHRFRFLSRPQLQQLLGLQSHQRLTLWLKDLSEKQFVRPYSSPSLTMQPTVYSLGKESIKYLKGVVKDQSSLKKIKWEANYSNGFREKCLTIADIYLQLSDKITNLHFRTKAELRAFGDLISPPPDAYFTINEQRYFLDVLTNVPIKYLHGRVRRYADYFEEGVWQAKTQSKFPTVILICLNGRITRQLKRHIEREYSHEPDLRFLVSSDRSLQWLLESARKS